MRIFSKTNKEKFKKELSEIDWETLYHEKDVNTAFNFFSQILRQAF